MFHPFQPPPADTQQARFDAACRVWLVYGVPRETGDWWCWLRWLGERGALDADGLTPQNGRIPLAARFAANSR